MPSIQSPVHELIVLDAIGAFPVNASPPLPVPVFSVGSPYANVVGLSCFSEPQPSFVAAPVSVSIPSSALVLSFSPVVFTVFVVF